MKIAIAIPARGVAEALDLEVRGRELRLELGDPLAERGLVGAVHQSRK
jgi:hypothetical protein